MSAPLPYEHTTSVPEPAAHCAPPQNGVLLPLSMDCDCNCVAPTLSTYADEAGYIGDSADDELQDVAHAPLGTVPRAPPSPDETTMVMPRSAIAARFCSHALMYDNDDESHDAPLQSSSSAAPQEMLYTMAVVDAESRSCVNS